MISLKNHFKPSFRSCSRYLHSLSLITLPASMYSSFFKKEKNETLNCFLCVRTMSARLAKRKYCLIKARKTELQLESEYKLSYLYCNHCVPIVFWAHHSEFRTIYSVLCIWCKVAHCCCCCCCRFIVCCHHQHFHP